MKKSIGVGIILGFLLASLEIYIWQFRSLSISQVDGFFLTLMGGALVLWSDWFRRWVGRVWLVQGTMVMTSSIIGLLFIAYISYRSLQYSLVIFWLIWHFVEFGVIYINVLFQKNREAHEH